MIRSLLAALVNALADRCFRLGALCFRVAQTIDPREPTPAPEPARFLEQIMTRIAAEACPVFVPTAFECRCAQIADSHQAPVVMVSVPDGLPRAVLFPSQTRAGRA